MYAAGQSDSSLCCAFPQGDGAAPALPHPQANLSLGMGGPVKGPRLQLPCGLVPSPPPRWWSLVLMEDPSQHLA